MARNREKSIAELRSFGEVMALVLLGLTAVLFWKERPSGYITLALGGLFLVFGLFAPEWLREVDKKWTLLGEKLSIVMSLVILALTFYFVMLPVGLLMRLFGKSSLKLTPDRSASTYWEASDHSGSGSRFYKPY